MKTLQVIAKENIENKLQELFSRAENVKKKYKENIIDSELYYSRIRKYRARFTGYLDAYADLGLLVDDEYKTYLETFDKSLDTILYKQD